MLVSGNCLLSSISRALNDRRGSFLSYPKKRKIRKKAFHGGIQLTMPSNLQPIRRGDDSEALSNYKEVFVCFFRASYTVSSLTCALCGLICLRLERVLLFVIIVLFSYLRRLNNAPTAIAISTVNTKLSVVETSTSVHLNKSLETGVSYFFLCIQ